MPQIAISVRVSASGDDGVHRSVGSHVFNATTGLVQIGYSAVTARNLGSWSVFRGVAIPQGAQIVSAHLTLRANATDSLTVVSGKIDGELTPNFGSMDHSVFDGLTFGDGTAAASHARIRTNRTSAIVSWSGVEAVTAGNDYQTPDFSEVIQEIVNQGGWASGNDLCIYWGDEDSESTAVDDTRRIFNSYNEDPNTAPLLEVVYNSGISVPTPVAFGPNVIKDSDEVVAI